MAGVDDLEGFFQQSTVCSPFPIPGLDHSAWRPMAAQLQGGRMQASEESIWDSVLPGLWNARIVVPPRGAEAHLFVSLIMFVCIPRIETNIFKVS